MLRRFRFVLNLPPVTPLLQWGCRACFYCVGQPSDGMKLERYDSMMRQGRYSRRLKSALFAAVVMLLVAAAVVVLLRGRRTAVSFSPDREAFPVAGVDLSAHNGDVDFEAMAADGISFVFLKASEGRSFKDKKFNENYWAARRAGLRVGAYHFFRFESSGEMQAINMLHSMRGKRFDLPSVIDVEEWTNPETELTDSVIRRVREMAAYLKERGLEVMVYSNRDGYEKFLDRKFNDCALWISSLRGVEPEHKWDFWQYTHRGRVEGVAGDVDLNLFNGDSARWDSCLRRWEATVR